MTDLKNVKSDLPIFVSGRDGLRHRPGNIQCLFRDRNLQSHFSLPVCPEQSPEPTPLSGLIPVVLAGFRA